MMLSPMKSGMGNKIRNQGGCVEPLFEKGFASSWNILSTVIYVVSACLFLIAVLIPTEVSAESRFNWATKAFKNNCEAVVCIQGDKVDELNNASRDSGKSYNGMGTGVIIDERGYIVTNFHVVDGIRKIQVTTYDQTQYIGTLLARDTDTDLAIIKISARKPLKTITLGRSHDLMPGENCLAIGNPYGYAFSLTDGRISGIERKVDVNDTLVYRVAIQTNTEINPGNSGGPLINVEGEMIGINAAIRQGAAGIAFAIPIDQVVEVAAKLMEEIGEQSSSHGLKIKQIKTDDENDLSLPSGKRFKVVVDSVENNTPGAKTDIRKGDVITGIGNYAISNTLDFWRALVDLKPGDDVVFSVKRETELLDLAVSMGQPKEEYFAHSARRNTGSPKRAAIAPKTTRQGKVSNSYDDLVWEVLGIRYTSIPMEEYKKDFPSKYPGFPHGGVVVKAVREGSSMAQKGVTPEDVIVGIHEWTTTSSNDMQYIAKNWSTVNPPKNEIEILLFRDGQLYYAYIPWKQR